MCVGACNGWEERLRATKGSCAVQGKVENSKVKLKLRCVGTLRAHNLLKENVVATRFLQLVPSSGRMSVFIYMPKRQQGVEFNKQGVKNKAKNRARTEAVNRAVNKAYLVRENRATIS
jgi:hypothetical protein